MLAGTIVIVWGVLDPGVATSYDRRRSGVMTLALVAVIFGAVALVYSALNLEEAYRFGKDIGVEEGFQRGRRIARPVVVDLTAEVDDDEIRVSLDVPEVRVRVPKENGNSNSNSNNGGDGDGAA